MTHYLRIDSSPRNKDSSSRALANSYFEGLGDVSLTQRDISAGFPFVLEDWIGANFTKKEARSDVQREALTLSDSLVAELKAADIIVMSFPVYNFGISAAMKSWIDLICRVGETFRYTENGPEGLLKNKKAILFLASGGTKQDSAIDFATPYLRHILGFIGITDVTIIAADGLGRDVEAYQARLEAAKALASKN